LANKEVPEKQKAKDVKEVHCHLQSSTLQKELDGKYYNFCFIDCRTRENNYGLIQIV
jgi:hypothetical protein